MGDTGLYAEGGDIFDLAAIAVGYSLALVALVPDKGRFRSRQVYVFDRDIKPFAQRDRCGKVAVGIRRCAEADEIESGLSHYAHPFLIGKRRIAEQIHTEL